MADRNRCWECSSRRLECSNERPCCRQCLAKGKECPGYGPKKPLQFCPFNYKDLKARGRAPNSTRKDDSDRFKNPTRGTNAPGTHPTPTPKPQTIQQPQQPRMLLSKAPKPNDLTFAEAIAYHNEMRESWYAPSHLSRNLFRYKIKSLKEVSTTTGHVLVIRGLYHRMLTASIETSPLILNELQMRAHYHLAQAIQSVRADLGEGDLSKGTFERRAEAISGVLALGFVDLFISMQPTWRPHFHAFLTFINEMGGLRHVLNANTSSQRSVICYTMMVISANATSPASDQTSPAFHYGMLYWFLDRYDTWNYPPFPCPRPLFALIIHINYLRARCSTSTPWPSTLQDETEAVFHAIENFSPSQWSKTTRKDHHSLWTLIAEIYLQAVRLYGLSALYSLDVGLSPKAIAIQEKISRHRATILDLMQNVPGDTLVRYCLVWPTVIAGVYASEPTQRASVCGLLRQASRMCGIMAPLVAEKVLMTFWGSGKMTWDECFDQPYIFVT